MILAWRHDRGGLFGSTHDATRCHELDSKLRAVNSCGKAFQLFRRYRRIAGVPRSERHRTAKDALDRVGLADRSHHWPNQLSGGEQQRVVIARAMVNDPALILADEPTGSLDSSTSDEILSLFEGLHRDGRTIIMVTHAAEVADRARRQITLHDGRILKDEG